MVDRRDANLDLINKASETQDATKEGMCTCSMHSYTTHTRTLHTLAHSYTTYTHTLVHYIHSHYTHTHAGIFRIQRQLAETEEIGSQTLEELRKQGNQMDDINSDLDKVSHKLDESAGLQSTFDKWAGNWFGGKKNQALAEAQAEIANRGNEANAQIKEVFEHETFSSVSRAWKPVG